MSHKRTLQELTLKDNFIFGAVCGNAGGLAKRARYYHSQIDMEFRLKS